MDDLERGILYYLVIVVKYVHEENKEIYYKDSIWQLFKVNFDYAPRIYNTCVIDLRNGKSNIAVYWNFPENTHNLEYTIIEIDSSRPDKTSFRRYIIDPKALSYTLTNVSRNLEYRISIGVFKNKNFGFNQVYVCHTVFVNTNSSLNIQSSL
ncbi:unnamed protein product [Gordionus sp. m RMFG-2023]